MHKKLIEDMEHDLFLAQCDALGEALREAEEERQRRESQTPWWVRWALERPAC